LSLSHQLCDDLGALELDYEGNRVSGVSHLYGLWGVALVLQMNGKSVAAYKQQLNDFYSSLRDSEAPHDQVRDDYKKSMTSRTKERFMRVKRVNALLAACGEQDLAVA
jgi:hypothetical protein